MAEVWVCNASPIICLAKIALPHLLVDLTSRLIIPEGVAREVETGPQGDPGVLWIRGPGAEFVLSPPAPIHSIAAWDLGLGETQVLETASAEPGLIAVIDDLAARNCAKAHGLPVIGTLGVLVVAKKAGRIDSVAPHLAALREVGLRADEALTRRVLQLAGEKE